VKLLEWDVEEVEGFTFPVYVPVYAFKRFYLGRPLCTLIGGGNKTLVAGPRIHDENSVGTLAALAAFIMVSGMQLQNRLPCTCTHTHARARMHTHTQTHPLF
jgi:hypothetical protein